MFKNREIRMKVVKTNNAADADEREARFVSNALFIHQMIKADVKQIALLVGIGYTVVKVLDAAGKVAVITAEKNL